MRFDDKELSCLVFSSYMNSNSLKEYSSVIKQLSNKYNLTCSYLRSFREVYLNNYASDDEKKSFFVKRRMMNFKPRYLDFCDRLFDLPIESRFDYLESNNVSFADLKLFFSRYKKHGGKYSSDVDAFLIDYKQFIDSKALNLKFKRFSLACDYYDNLIKLGFYGIAPYVRFICSPGDYNSELYRAIKLKDCIVKSDEELWYYYAGMMEDNRRKSFIIMKDRIDELNFRLVTDDCFDIIDYYMLIGMSFDEYRSLCRGFISVKQMAVFNIFVDKFSSFCKDIDCERITLGSNYEIDGRVITDDEKLLVFEFLHRNDIPLVYFYVALKKFVSGGLDVYLYDGEKVLKN